MAKVVDQLAQYHTTGDAALIYGLFGKAKTGPSYGHLYPQQVDQFIYTFENFFHPYVGELIAKLNQTSVSGMLDPEFLAGLKAAYTAKDYTLNNSTYVSTTLNPRNIDVSIGGRHQPAAAATLLALVCLLGRRRHSEHQQPAHSSQHARYAAHSGPNQNQGRRDHGLQRHTRESV